MALISSSKLFYINSADRVSGTTSDFQYQFQMPADVKFDKVCVLQMYIPKSYYLVVPNESFELQEEESFVTVLIPQGNYNRKSFALTLATQLNYWSPNAYTYTVTYSNSSTSVDTGKYTFNVANSLGIQPIFIFDGKSDIYSHMGFNIGSYQFGVDNTLTAPNVMNLQKENTLFLHSDIANNGSDNVLQEVFSVETSDYSSIVFQQYNIDGYSKDLSGVSNNVYRFYLTDENSNPINLNGQDFNVTLLMYKKNNVWDMLKESLRVLAHQK
jgi:hypothetical protein